MTSKIDKSLIEEWEMKDAAWKAFQESGFQSYIEYINNSVKEKYNNKYWKELKKEK